MKISVSAVAPRILGSRGTSSKFVLYVLKDMYAKFGAFTRFVTIFVNFDANGLVYGSCYFVRIVNERTSVASFARAFKSTRLIIRFQYTSNKKVPYVFVAFE